jgi:hypothetical protein
MVAGSSPDEVDFFCNLPNTFSRNMALGSTESLTEMSTRNLPGGLKGDPEVLFLSLSWQLLYIVIGYYRYYRLSHYHMPVCVECEAVTAVTCRVSILWDITPCSPLKASRRFGGKYRLHIQGLRQ